MYQQRHCPPRPLQPGSSPGPPPQPAPFARILHLPCSSGHIAACSVPALASSSLPPPLAPRKSPSNTTSRMTSLPTKPTPGSRTRPMPALCWPPSSSVQWIRNFRTGASRK
jgi:hypothetical protein